MTSLRKNSFTLIEALIALVIISISSLGLYSTMLTARTTQNASKKRLHAVKLVHEKLEGYLQVPYNTLYDNRTLFGAKKETVPARHWTFAYDETINDYSATFKDAQLANIYTTISPYTYTENGNNVRYCRVDVTLAWVDKQTGLLLKESAYAYVYDSKIEVNDE